MRPHLCKWWNASVADTDGFREAISLRSTTPQASCRVLAGVVAAVGSLAAAYDAAFWMRWQPYGGTENRPHVSLPALVTVQLVASWPPVATRRLWPRASPSRLIGADIMAGVLLFGSMLSLLMSVLRRVLIPVVFAFALLLAADLLAVMAYRRRVQRCEESDGWGRNRLL